MTGGFLKISLSRCWLCIRRHFPISIVFRLGNKAGPYCVNNKRQTEFFTCAFVSLLLGCFPCVFSLFKVFLRSESCWLSRRSEIVVFFVNSALTYKKGKPSVPLQARLSQ